jgi:hypothetical protein
MNSLRNLVAGISTLLALMTVSATSLAATDTTQPTTSAALAGIKGNDGWYTTSVTVTLAAADGSGVAKTEYSLDNVTWQTYATPFTLDRDGDQYVYFRSTDVAGNIETPAKSQEIKINKTGLVGWWKMDGDWKDASVAGNNGTPFYGATFSPNAKVGTQAGSFNTSNGYVSVNDNATLQLTSAMTLAAWINPGDITNYRQIISKWGYNGAHSYQIGLQPTGKIRADISRDGTGYDTLTSSTAPIVANTWQHVAATFNNGILKLYVNGVEVASKTSALTALKPGSTPLNIGRDPANIEYFKGLIDEALIYNRALSATEIQRLYLDTVVALPTVTPVPSPTAAASITLSGTKPADTAIVVNGNILVPLDGTTSWQANYSLAAGINNLTVTALNKQNLSSLPVTLTVVLDTTPPADPVIDSITAPINITSKTITGTKSSDSVTVAVSCAGATVGPISYPTATTWNVNISGLKEGNNTITVRAADMVGNQSKAVSATITVDTTLPAVGATPAGGNYNSPQTVALVANESAVIYYTADGSTPTTSAAIYSQPISIPANATLKYFGRDLAGNNSEIKTEHYVIDTTPPALAVSTLGDGAYTNNEILNIAGTVTDNTEVKGITVDGTAVQVNADGSFSYALRLNNGTNPISIEATDSVGNVAADTRQVILDQTAPVLAVTAPADNSKTGKALLEVSGTVDKTSVVTVKVKDIIQSALMNGEAFTATVILEPGYNTIEIFATDLAGNKISQKRTVVFDDQVPSLAAIAPNQDIRTNQKNLTIKGTAFDALSAVGVTINKDNETFTPPVIDGTFEQVMSFTEEKAYAIVITATNEVGTMASVQRNVIYDITPPALSIDPVTSPTSQTSLSVTGAREAGTTVTVTCPTATVGTVSYPGPTTWQANLSGLTEGENVLTAASADAAGNAVTATTTVVLATKPPQITLTTTPDVIWPPNHKMVPVTIGGGIDANGATIKSVSISVSDEYGKYQYNNLKFGSTVMLEAWRKGNDKDGRKYTITVVITDKAGNKTAKTATVTVPLKDPKPKKNSSRLTH